MRNRAAPPAAPLAPLVPPVHRAVVVHVRDRRRRAPPAMALPELHVVILASSCRRRVVRVAPLRHFAGPDGDEGRELAGPRAAAVGELAGDFGGEVPEEVGHGDEATADDAGRDLGDAVDCAWSAVREGSNG